MKNYIVIVVVSFITSFSFIGCSDDDKKDDQYPLSGSVWEIRYDNSLNGDINLQTYTLKFGREDYTLYFSQEYIETMTGDIIYGRDTVRGTYIYTPPTVTLTPNGEEDKKERYSITNNRMVSEDGERIFIKQ